MSKQQRYPEEFKIETIRQVTKRQYPVAEVAGGLVFLPTVFMPGSSVTVRRPDKNSRMSVITTKSGNLRPSYAGSQRSVTS